MTKLAIIGSRNGLMTFGLVALAAFLAIQTFERNRQVVVLFPREGLIEALPEGTRIISSAPMELTLMGSYGLTQALRDVGASIVLPAGKGGCAARSLP